MKINRNGVSETAEDLLRGSVLSFRLLAAAPQSGDTKGSEENEASGGT